MALNDTHAHAHTRSDLGPSANRIWGPSLRVSPPPPMSIYKQYLDDGGPSSFGAPGRRSILAHI